MRKVLMAVLIISVLTAGCVLGSKSIKFSLGGSISPSLEISDVNQAHDTTASE